MYKPYKCSKLLKTHFSIPKKVVLTGNRGRKLHKQTMLMIELAKI